jgi:hypothetical protein
LNLQSARAASRLYLITSSHCQGKSGRFGATLVCVVPVFL